MLKTSQIFIYVFVLNQLHSTKACLNISISLNQKIENPGFHKIINWLISFNDDIEVLKADFVFALHLKIPPGIYVNPDELADLVRQNELNGKLIGNVNVESPMHLSKEHEVILYFRMNENGVVLSLPIHLRYQKANIQEQFGEVILEKPSLLVNSTKICGLKSDDKIINLPCYDSNEDCFWVNITYEGVFDESILLVPVGNLNHYPFVVIITIFLGCIGCLYILSILMSTKLKEE